LLVLFTQNDNIVYYSLRPGTFGFMRTALFWVITQQVVVIPYRRFGTTYRSYIQGSGIKKTSGKNYNHSLRNDPEASNHAFSYRFEVLSSEICQRIQRLSPFTDYVKGISITYLLTP